MASTEEDPNTVLARAIVSALAADPDALEQLRHLVSPTAIEEPSAPPAYTVAGLAAALGITQRMVRNAISRGELDGVKRGGRWYVAADALDSWTHSPPIAQRRRVSQPRRERQRPLRDTIARLAAP